MRTNATTLSYEAAAPLIPSSQIVVTIPGGAHGLRSAGGATLATSRTVAFDVAAGDTLRLQQLLAQLDYLPFAFTPSGPAPSRADLAEDQPGTFSWRWPSLPSQLTSQWTQGTLERDHQGGGRGASRPRTTSASTGSQGPPCGRRCINDVINDKPTPRPTSTSS